jgi:hypothetical protein
MGAQNRNLATEITVATFSVSISSMTNVRFGEMTIDYNLIQNVYNQLNPPP